MLESIVRFVLGLIAPGAPGWVAMLIAKLLPMVVKITKDAIEDKELDGPSTIEEVRATLDEALDGIPGWGDLEEERRDKVLDGLAELSLFIYESASSDEDQKVTTKRMRKVLKGLKQRKVRK